MNHADQDKINEYYNEELQSVGMNYFTWEGLGILLETTQKKSWWKLFLGTLRQYYHINSPTINPDTKNQNDINITIVNPKVFPYLLYYHLIGDTMTLETLITIIVNCSLED